MGGTCLLDLVWETLNENASRQARVPDYIYIKGTGEPFFHYKNQQKMRRLKSTARLYIKFAKVRETFDLSDEGPTIFSKIFWWGAPASPGPSLHVGGGVVSPQRAFESASGLTVYWFWIPDE